MKTKNHVAVTYFLMVLLVLIILDFSTFIYAKELYYPNYKTDSTGHFDLLNVNGLNTYKMTGEFMLPHYVERIERPASLPIEDIMVNYSEPVELTLNIPTYEVVGRIPRANAKNCDTDSFDGPKYTFTVEGFSLDTETVWIEIFPESYDCKTNKLVYYKKFSYEYVYNKEQNAIVSYKKEIKARPNSNINISVQIYPNSTGSIRLVDKYSGKYFEINITSENAQKNEISNITFNVNTVNDYDTKEYMLQYVKNNKIVESNSLYIETMPFFIEGEVRQTGAAKKQTAKEENKYGLSLNITSYIENTTVNISLAVKDWNYTELWNFETNKMLVKGINNFDFDINESCRECDIYIVAQNDLGYDSFSRNLLFYAKADENKNTKLKTNALLYIIIIIVIVAVLFVTYNVWGRKKYY